jgi:hypothetical protein
MLKMPVATASATGLARTAAPLAAQQRTVSAAAQRALSAPLSTGRPVGRSAGSNSSGSVLQTSAVAQVAFTVLIMYSVVQELPVPGAQYS